MMKEQKNLTIYWPVLNRNSSSCQQNSHRNVHWLEKDKSEELVWHHSKENLKALRKYINVQKPHSFVPGDLENILKQRKHQKLMLIADKARMDKTAVLAQLSKQIKQMFPAHLLVRIDLNDYTALFDAQK